MFIDAVEQSLQNGTSFNEVSFTEKITTFEDNWTKGQEKYSSKPEGDCIFLNR
jgi:hypothetical protein